jgi:hypothetical protein
VKVKLRCSCVSHDVHLEQVAGEVIGAVSPAAAQWLDDGSEHPHRIALSVQAARVPELCERLKEGFVRRNVQVCMAVPQASPLYAADALSGNTLCFRSSAEASLE